MNKDKSEQQSQQGLVENYNCYLGLCYCSQPCLYKPPTEEESEAEVESEILKQLLIKQAQKTRKETLEEVVEKFGRYNDGCGCCMDQKLEELIQSLINNQ